MNQPRLVLTDWEKVCDEVIRPEMLNTVWRMGIPENIRSS